LTIAEFLQTGKPPVDPAQTLEIYEFMTAAQISFERGGAVVSGRLAASSATSGGEHSRSLHL